MTTITKAEFEAALAQTDIASDYEPRIENDGEYRYDCYDLPDGEEWGFITYKTGEEPTYSIHSAE